MLSLNAIVPIGRNEKSFPIRKAMGKPVVWPTYNNGTWMWNHVVSQPKVPGFIVLKNIEKGTAKLRR